VTPDPEAIASARTHLQRSSARLFAPHRCVDAVEAATLPLSEGLKRERELFMDCMASPQRQGLIHAFFAERAVADVPEAKATPRDVGTVGVIGGGTMGAGIATALLQSGLSVIMIERDAQALAKGRDTVASALDGGVKRGKMTAEARNAILADKFSGATDHAALAQADLIIEAVFESMDVKRDVFASLDRHARPGAILATNTSYLDIDAIAAVTSRPQDVIGLHFFSPAHVMKLLEIVVPARASAEAVATGFALAKRMKKIAVRAGVCDGFIGNRILAHYRKAADYMMLDGASPYEIDAALRDFGFAMGPYEVADLAGLDIGWATRKRLAPTRDPKERYVAIADRICENGWFGRKTGQGFYLHEKGGKPQSNPAVEAIIADERARSGMAPRHFSAEEIVTRYMTAMANESARVVEDGIALRPIDVDAVKLFGHEGGPLAWADRRGLAVVLADTARLADTDPHFWRQPALMRALAERDADFASLNKKDRT
jgi:3-hydroxyacyl-CoA dehydrogenase